MTDEVKEVRGLLIPLQGIRLVFPDSIVLQIYAGAEIIPVNNSPTWLLGTIVWQKRIIPTLSFEAVSSHQYHQVENPRVLVLKSIYNIENMPFYAITLADIPKPVLLNDGNLAVVENASPPSSVILNEVLVDGEPASIPDLEALEEILMSAYDLFTGQTPAT